MTTRAKPTANSSAKWRAIERRNVKTQSSAQPSAAALTLLEVLVVVVIVVVLGLVAARLLLPSLGGSRKSPRIKCVNNNKQIGTAYREFLNDTCDGFPLQTTNGAYLYPPGGTGIPLGAVVSTSAEAWQVFHAMWKELQSPKVLLCPSDRSRTNFNRVTDFNGTAGAPGSTTTTSLGHPGNQNFAVSYAPQALADADRPDAVLNVDRNINFTTIARSTNAPGAASGTRLVVNSPAASASMFFVRGKGYDIHNVGGNVLFADGRVEQIMTPRFESPLTNAGALYGWGTAASNGWGASVFLMP